MADVKKGALAKVITYANTSATLVGSIPPNSVMTEIKLMVSADFTAGVVDIGSASSAAAYANDIAVTSAGKILGTMTAAACAVRSAVGSTDIYAVYVPGSTAPAEGSATVVIEYVQL